MGQSDVTVIPVRLVFRNGPPANEETEVGKNGLRIFFMACPVCRSQAAIQNGFCPSCHSFAGSKATARLSGERDLWVLGLIVVALLLSAGYLLLHKKKPAQVSANLSRVRRPPMELPVEHGGIANHIEMRANGTLYFVPMGRQAISVQSLADYYRQKFNIQINILAPVPLSRSSCVPERRQCIAEEMLLDVQRHYPKVAADPDSVMIMLTDEDVFPRAYGWEFTYSLHIGNRLGMVSTRRMDPAFWGDPPDEKRTLASTRQMLTKYIALLYFHVPISYDPSSVMYQPLTPDGGADDLYESDIHSEQSANGFRGSGWPCISFQYSYETGKLRAEPGLSDCRNQDEPSSTHEENFQVQLGRGNFLDRTFDLELNSTPAIKVHRAYTSDFLKPLEFGFGTSHNYDSYLNSDGVSKLTYIDVIREDGNRFRLRRVSPGLGFSPSAVYRNEDNLDEVYGATMTWETTHFKLQYRDGTWSTYLACGDYQCFWTGYQDAKGSTLRFERNKQLVLQSLTASDEQRVDFELDDHGRAVQLTASNGKKVMYEYNSDGCLERVTRTDGQVTLYGYDARHRMTSVAVARNPRETPQMLVTNEYDSSGRLIRHTVTGVGIYQIEYLSVTGSITNELRITDPEGLVWNIVFTDDGYTARTLPVRYPAATLARQMP